MLLPQALVVATAAMCQMAREGELGRNIRRCMDLERSALFGHFGPKKMQVFPLVSLHEFGHLLKTPKDNPCAHPDPLPCKIQTSTILPLVLIPPSSHRIKTSITSLHPQSSPKWELTSLYEVLEI